MQRLCFLSPDVVHARQVVDDLKGHGISESNIYVLAKLGVEVEGLPDSGPESDDFLPAYQRGLELGGAAGLLLGLTALVFPPAGIVVGGGLVLLVGLWSAGIGGILASIAGGAFSSSRLKSFESAINEGKLLIMADVPKNEVEKFEGIIKRLDPEVEVSGIEPPAKLIP
ncbi:general stress protein [Pseudomonadales bacterium]|nr:general stress protein [Pseudomonadales bacterium]MDC1368291.1 general stress protein [Pseudomonadales bacterium]